jgi:hypothetical protein
MTAATSPTRPEPAAVGARAGELLATIEADEAFGRLSESSQQYSNCWVTYAGMPIVPQFDLVDDTPPLFDEALKVLVLKTAVYELSGGDEHLAELVVSAPVDEMVHAVLAQYTLCVQIQQRLGFTFVHMTDRERFGWNPGDYTDQCYQAAGWGTPPARYWIDDNETRRRLAILAEHYATIGVHDAGRRINVDFDTPALAG